MSFSTFKESMAAGISLPKDLIWLPRPYLSCTVAGIPTQFKVKTLSRRFDRKESPADGAGRGNPPRSASASPPAGKRRHPLFAQTDFASIRGTVTDQTGAAIPAASLQLKNIDTGAQQAAVADATGNFHFETGKVSAHE
jgi:hypothetical protein